jgi:hypothetical protein
MPHALNGLRVASFESRRSAEMAELIRNYGGEPIQAPSMREVPLTDQREALAFGETLLPSSTIPPHGRGGSHRGVQGSRRADA